MKRILLTGASGFIGRNLLEGLSSRYEVLAPLRGEMDLLDDDGVRRYMRAHPVDAVVYSAVAPAHRNIQSPDRIAYKNIRMFMNVARNEDCFGRFIQLGSGSEYDMRHYRPKMDESYFGEHVPEDEHGFSKYVCARHVERSANMVNLRLFGVFGKHEDYQIRFISNVLCKILLGKPVTIKQNRRFDYIWVEDLAPVVSFFIENQALHKAYNVTPDHAVELKSLAALALKTAGADAEIMIAEPGMGVEYSGNNARWKAEMPDFRPTALDVAVRRLYDWYASHPEIVREEALRADK